ncbi:hypothetical protein EIP91_000846 [Steccherinum ochraceum]|uniref:Protein kinase domain-containing protein n=1 Tax=Steccherinum ochraceum TaxID=92696 RepID=A0A4R0RPZ9_9APHY|nr:hypothetical protein EIP91_000846 [Steccherinum ochraceum]
MAPSRRNKSTKQAGLGNGKPSRSQPYPKPTSQPVVTEEDFFNPPEVEPENPEAALTQAAAPAPKIKVPRPPRVLSPSKHGVRPDPLKLTDLVAIRKLGAGSNGTMVAVKVKREESKVKTKHPLERQGSVMAVKIIPTKAVRMNEKGLLDSDIVIYRSAERRALWTLPWNPFIAGLISGFSDGLNLYQVQELAPCFSLAQRIAKRGVLPLSDIRFYFACLVLGLEFLHTWGVAHRDIKPDNLMLGSDGYLMITDFGHAAHFYDEGVWTTLGTMLYSPPEQLGYNEFAAEYWDGRLLPRISLDWWAAGVTLYEMATTMLSRGVNTEQQQKDLLKQLMHGELFYPDNFDADLKELIQGMLEPHPNKRFGLVLHEVVKGSESYVVNKDVRDDRFMSSVDWIAMKRRLLVSPYIPTPFPDYDKGTYHKGFLIQREMPGLQIERLPPHRDDYLREGARERRDEQVKHLLPP